MPTALRTTLRTVLRTVVRAVGSRLDASVVAAPAFVARVSGVVYCTAGAVGMMAPLFPQPPHVQSGRILGIGLVAVLVGAVTLRWGGRFPSWGAHVLVGNGTAFITAATLWAGHSPTAVAMAGFYVFVALDCGLFFTTRAATVHLAAAVLACTAVMSWHDRYAIGAGVMVSATAVVVARGTAWVTQVAAAADLDPLTGLANRRRLDNVLDVTVHQAHRCGTPMSVALLDLDHFKAVNDTLGHEEGDRLLVAVARAWSAQLQPGQLLARQGGDEFVLVLPGLGLDAAAELARRLAAVLPEGRSCSIGVAALRAGEAVHALLARADAALYDVKRTGRGQVGTADAAPAPSPRSSAEQGPPVLGQAPPDSVGSLPGELAH